MRNVKIPYLQVRSDCLIFYELPAVRKGRKSTLPCKPAYSGSMSNGAKKRISKAIDILIQRSPAKITFNPITRKYFPFDLNFVTLTISSHKNVNTDFAYKNLMKPFLRKMRQSGNFSYIWKAEFQKRGQLHYHLATNTFLPYTNIRNSWNNLQRKHRLLDDYAKRFGHYDANSTDVHATYKIGNMKAYLTKYLSKTDNLKVKGKTWDCSTDLKQNRFSFTPSWHAEEKIIKGLKSGQIKQIDLDHCIIFKMSDPVSFLPVSAYKDYLKWQS